MSERESEHEEIAEAVRQEDCTDKVGQVNCSPLKLYYSCKISYTLF